MSIWKNLWEYVCTNPQKEFEKKFCKIERTLREEFNKCFIESSKLIGMCYANNGRRICRVDMYGKKVTVYDITHKESAEKIRKDLGFKLIEKYS